MGEAWNTVNRIPRLTAGVPETYPAREATTNAAQANAEAAGDSEPRTAFFVRGYGLSPLESVLERENRKLRDELERMRRDHEVAIQLFRELRA